MAYYNFRKDLPIARATEKEVGKLLETLYGAEILDFGNNNEYDILAKIKGKEYRFEVKEDFLCEKTGNVGLEFECRGKISGIQTTKSDFYIYKLHTKNFGIQFVLHTVASLKNKIENKQYFIIVNGGDKGSNSMNYLFKYNVFMKGANILSTLDKNQ